MTIVGNESESESESEPSLSQVDDTQEENFEQVDSSRTADEELSPSHSNITQQDMDEELGRSTESKGSLRGKGGIKFLRACFDCRRWSEACPRLYWFTAGVVIPLWVLIFVASFFGLGLATLEAPNEINNNNIRLKNQYRLKSVEDTLSKIVKAGPTFCMKQYVERVLDRKGSAQQYNDSAWLYNATAFDIHDVLSDGSYYDILADFQSLAEYRQLELQAGLVDNVTDAFVFLNDCGIQLGEFVSDLSTPSNESVIFKSDEPLDFGDLTFNWNRCADGNNETRIDIPWGFGERTYEAYHPEAQRVHYETTWYKDMTEIYDRLYAELLPEPENATRRERAEANLTAFRTATFEASGESGCIVNTPAGSWFFFTVMTTIGYGNQAPETAAGQAMLYTLGFLSILLFAGIASRAGNITVLLFEDMMQKFRMEWLNSRFVAPAFWGSLYYVWLIFLGIACSLWKRSRMDENPPFADAYWFAYVSTTTVGLGDIYLEPEVLVTEDLLTFSLMFLIGFVLLASFLEKLSVLVKNDDRGLKRLKENLSNTTICCGHSIMDPVAREVVNLGSHTVKASVHTVKAGVHIGSHAVRSGVELGSHTTRVISESIHIGKSSSRADKDDSVRSPSNEADRSSITRND